MPNKFQPRSPSASSTEDGSDAEGQTDDKFYEHRSGQVSPIKTSPRPESSSVARKLSLPPAIPSPDYKGSRLLDVSNMLNPPSPTQKSEQSKRRTADEAELETPQRVSYAPHHAPVTKSVPQSPEGGVPLEVKESHAPSMYSTFPRAMRRPVGPSTKLGSMRASMLPMINTQHSAKVDARLSPFPSSSSAWAPAPIPSHSRPSVHQNAPLSPAVSLGVPMQPQLSAGYPFPSLTHPSQEARSRAASVSSNAPSPTASPYPYVPGSTNPHNRPLGTPPITAYGGSYSPRYGSISHQQGSSYGSQALQQQQLGNGGSSRDHYPVMHFSNSEGQLSIPIDTNAASKVADEKRKRNAGASARFRQRRKERERDMGSRIAELEQKLRIVEQERDHYRNLALKYAGAPLPSNAASPAPSLSRQNSQGGVRLSPRMMAMSHNQHLQNEQTRLSPPHGTNYRREEFNMGHEEAIASSKGYENMGRTNSAMGAGRGSVSSIIEDSRVGNQNVRGNRAEDCRGSTRDNAYADVQYHNERSHEWNHAQHQRERH